MRRIRIGCFMRTIDGSFEPNKNVIIIENLQSKKEFGEDLYRLFEAVVHECMMSSDIKDKCEISVTLVDNERIREINKEFRNIDSPTDVLSFPMVEMIDGSVITTDGDYDLDEGLLLLGDIVMSLEKAGEQALEYGHPYEREIAFLLTHGVFHLLGYDHQNDAQEAIMLGKQEEVLLKLGLARE